MKVFLTIILLLTCVYSANHIVSMFYCGFGDDYCGQSTTDDVNPNAKFIILAFANTQPDGSILVDNQKFPTKLITQWRKNGKKVFISVGGQNGNWNYVFASTESRSKFIESITAVIKAHKLDGVDLDIENYFTAPRIVAETIIDLKKSIMTLGRKYLIVSPQCVAVYQGSPVPPPDQAGQAFNYFVPIINLADSSIDYYQPQAYNNWYDSMPGGSLNYYKDVYLHWRNMKSLCTWCDILPNFAGVKGTKLLIGLLASTSAGGASYYGSPETIKQFKNWIAENGHSLQGFMMWDSHWDEKNGFAISNACSE